MSDRIFQCAVCRQNFKAGRYRRPLTCSEECMEVWLLEKVVGMTINTIVYSPRFLLRLLQFAIGVPPKNVKAKGVGVGSRCEAAKETVLQKHQLISPVGANTPVRPNGVCKQGHQQKP